MTYVAIDSYLEKSGKLGFVITQSVFKTVGAGQGFRRFTLGDGTPLGVLAVDDMTVLQPFEGASNRTSIVVLEKGRPTRYPVTYNLWRKKVRGVGIGTDFPFPKITDMTTYRQFVAQPVDAGDPTSAWLTGRPRALAAVRKVLGESDYEAHAGVFTGGANGVYWVNVTGRTPQGLAMVANLTEGARTKVDGVQAAIEPDLLYPLLRGRDVNRWRGEPSAHVLITHESGMRLNAIPEERMRAEYAKTYAYLKRFEDVLRRRAAYGRYFRDTAPFYSMFDVGNYTFAPHKVVWREQANRLTCCVVDQQDDKTVIPDHKLMLVDCSRADEAHFVCACLNSSLGQFVAKSYTQETGMDPHIIEHVRIPRFTRGDKVHQELAALSKQAHEAAADGDQERVSGVEKRIDELAAALWGLTKIELKEIQESLAELIS
jgi:hypothetical protein